MSIQVWMASLAVACSLTLCNAAKAENSNRNEVRDNLNKGGWTVIWGKNFTEGDWVQGTAAIAESIAAENPGPFLRWFEQVLSDNLTKIERNLVGIARQDLERWIAQSLKQKSIVTYKGLQIEAGFATYNRWQRTVVEVPDGIEYQGIKSKIKMKTVENKIPLPNWHQFYVRYKLVPTNGGQPNHPPQNNVTRNEFRYNTGAFVRNGNGTWTEHRNNNASSSFREIGRNANVIELFDAQRGMFVRLLGNRGEFRTNTSAQWTRWSGSEGRWVR